ncbi:MAG: head-tail connector protein [Beijerinckiaceae bacterium]|nr:head-tail connector protein [Beijerinckiaceae bacterium]
MFKPFPPVLVTPPAAPPVSLEEAKAHLRVDHDEENALIEALIAAATAHLDGWTGILGRCLVTQTWRQDLREFPAGGTIRLPFPAPGSVSVTYYDAANAEQTLAPSAYHVLDDIRGGAIELAASASWPAVYDRPDAVSVTFNAGYGAGNAVPAALKAAIKLMIGDLYMNRETVAKTGVSVPMSTAAHMLIASYRRARV